jgi:hypothetical protein
MTKPSTTFRAPLLAIQELSGSAAEVKLYNVTFGCMARDFFGQCALAGVETDELGD